MFSYKTKNIPKNLHNMCKDPKVLTFNEGDINFHRIKSSPASGWMGKRPTIGSLPRFSVTWEAFSCVK